MGFFKNLFTGSKLSLKRKPGGTLVGNFLRGVVSKVTNGQFGQGNMMLQEGETTDQANARLLQAGGVGAKAFNDALPTDSVGTTSEAFKNGVIMQKIKSIAPIALGLIAAVLVGRKIFSKKGKSKM